MRHTAFASVLLATFAVAIPAQSQDRSDSHSSMHGSSSGMQGAEHARMKSSPNATKAPFDLQFIDTMAAHHQSAIEMAELVEKRSAHDELKKMAKKMIDDQQGEIKQLKEWKQQWYADKGEAMNMQLPGMMESMKGMPMDQLKDSEGEKFDVLFIQTMTKHHQGAIKMAQEAQKRAQHPEIKKLAQGIISEQKKEIAQMAKWNKAWNLASK